MSCYFCTALQLHDSPADCAKELFKPSNGMVSLLVCILKKLEVEDFSLFVGDVISGVGFRAFWPRFPGPGC